MIICALATDIEQKALFGRNSPEMAGHAVKPVVTGIGPVNAAAMLAETLAHADRVLGVVNLGIAGSFDLHRFPMGEKVVVSREIWPEFGLCETTGINPRALGFPLAKVQGAPVWDRLDLNPDTAAAAMGLLLPSEWPRCTSLTVAGVTGTRDRAMYLARTYNADIENMEGFALALVCAKKSIPFLEMRSVSNLVGSREDRHWAMQPALAGLAKIRAALKQNR